MVPETILVCKRLAIPTGVLVEWKRMTKHSKQCNRCHWWRRSRLQVNSFITVNGKAWGAMSQCADVHF